MSTVIQVQEDATKQVKSLTWSNVNYAVKVKQGKKTVDKPLMENMNGQVLAGQVVGIMGGSGAGKSTLLNTHAGRIGPGLLSGDIQVDGLPRDPSTWNRQCAYVEQDDIMFRNLSVFETLRFSAMLRLPSSMPRAEKLERVEKVIAALGLQGW